MPTGDERRSAYHHGDLRRVLLAKAVVLLDERGVEGFSLREVARRADVASAAPSHHFGNVTGLLTAVATAGFRQLASSFEDVLRQKRAPVEHVVGVCEAYVRHCQHHPGTASIMFRSELLDKTDEALIEARPEPLHLLQDAVRSALFDGASVERVDAVSKVLWATMHGLIALDLDDDEALNARAGFAARAVIAGAGFDV